MSKPANELIYELRIAHHNIQVLSFRLAAAEKAVEAARAWTKCPCLGCGVCIESISESVAAYDAATKGTA